MTGVEKNGPKEVPIRYSERFYKSALMVTAVGKSALGGFCGCGTDAEWGVIYHMLKAMNGEVKEPDDCIKEYMVPSDTPICWETGQSPYNNWGFSHAPISEFLAKFLDSVGLTEHGNTVVWGWLTTQGEAYLRAMDNCIDEYCEVHGLDKDEFRKGPLGFSEFDIDKWLAWARDDVFIPKWVWTLQQHMVMDEEVALHTTYRLFTGSETGLWPFLSEELTQKIDKMLNETLDGMHDEEEGKE